MLLILDFNTVKVLTHVSTTCCVSGLCSGTTQETITGCEKIDVPGEPVAQPLKLGDAQSLSITPHHVNMLHCDKPKPHLNKRRDHFVTSKGISGSY